MSLRINCLCLSAFLASGLSYAQLEKPKGPANDFLERLEERMLGGFSIPEDSTDLVPMENGMIADRLSAQEKVDLLGMISKMPEPSIRQINILGQPDGDGPHHWLDPYHIHFGDKKSPIEIQAYLMPMHHGVMGNPDNTQASIRIGESYYHLEGEDAVVLYKHLQRPGANWWPRKSKDGSDSFFWDLGPITIEASKGGSLQIKRVKKKYGREDLSLGLGGGMPLKKERPKKRVQPQSSNADPSSSKEDKHGENPAQGPGEALAE